jgi:hypothetical protein
MQILPVVKKAVDVEIIVSFTINKYSLPHSNESL